MNIDGKELNEEQRLKWLADHQNDDVFNPYYWTLDPSHVGGIEPEPRKYPPEPAVMRESDFTDDPGAPGPDAYTATEKRSRAFWGEFAAIIAGGLAFMLIFWGLLSGEIPTFVLKHLQ